MKNFILALQFLTVCTLRSDLVADDRDMARSRAWYSLVGGLLGGVLACAAWLLGCWLPPWSLAGVLVLLWGGLTRFLHYDGVADTADALVHITSRERALEIMKDTRVGSFGICAVAGLMLIKFGALASLSGPKLLAALVVAPVLARTLAALLAGLLPPARPGVGLGASSAGGQETWPDLVTGGVGLALALLAGGLWGAAAALAVLLLGLVLGWWYMRRVGGVTGDTLGASLEAAEALVLLVFTASMA